MMMCSLITLTPVHGAGGHDRAGERAAGADDDAIAAARDRPAPGPAAEHERIQPRPGDLHPAHLAGCVQDGILPKRGIPDVPSAALPAELVYLLINRVGLGEADVAGMTKDQAIARLNRYWTTGS